MQDGCPRGACGEVRQLRAYGDLIQFLPRQALSEVPGDKLTHLGRGEEVRAASGPVFPSRVHHSVVPRRLRQLRREEAVQHPFLSDVRKPARTFPQGVRCHSLGGVGTPHMGLEHEPPSAHPLHRLRRRPQSRRETLDPYRRKIPPRCQKALGKLQVRLPEKARILLSGTPDSAGRGLGRLGCVLQEAIRRSGEVCRIHRALHAPRRHLQQQDKRFQSRGRHRHHRIQGLQQHGCRRRSGAEDHGAHRGRVHPQIHAARPAAGVPQDTLPRDLRRQEEKGQPAQMPRTLRTSS